MLQRTISLVTALALTAFATSACSISLAAPEPESEQVTPSAGLAEVRGPRSEVHHQPFTPYDPGPPESLWRYDQLTPAEQAVADKGRDTTKWEAIHAGFARASAELAERAQQQAAQLLIGLDDLSQEGVIR